ncbi:MAG: DUF5615 family PIN-like protein [Dehalococcoidia bacterium]
MKYYLDEMFSAVVAAMLRAQGIDAVSALEIGRNHVADAVHLASAAAEGRCVVTMNVRDFARLTTEFLQNAYLHAGVVLVPASTGNDDYAVIVQALVSLHDTYPEGLDPYAVLWLPPPPSL